VQDRKAKLFDNITNDDLLKVAASLINLTLHSGWGTWEGMIRESREAALENLAMCGPEDIRYWQGYVAALLGVLEGPRYLADRAKEIQDEKQAETGDLIDKVRVGFGTGEASI